MSAVAHPSEPTGGAGTWTPRLVLSLTSIVLLLEMLTVGYIMVSVALPQIETHFQTTQGAWMLTSYLLVGAVATPLLGKLADMYGKRKILLICIGLSAVGSAVTAAAPTYGVMVAGRALAGALTPCVFIAYSLIRDVFPPRTIALSVSIVTTGLGLFAIPAPFLTGWCLDNFGFRGIFWFFAIATAVFGLLILLTTDESTLRLRSRMDFLGAALLGLGIAGVLVAVSFGPTWGWTNGSTLAWLLGGIAFIVGWLVSARMVREPLLDPNVLRQRSIVMITVSASAAYGLSTVYTVLMPMMTMPPRSTGLGYGFGVSAKAYAIFQAPQGGMIVVGGALVGVLVGRNVRPRILMTIGMVLVVAGFLLTSLLHDDKALLIVFAVITGTGLGFAYAAVPNLLIESVPPQLQASTSSIANTFQTISSAAMPVVVFAVLNNSYIAPIPRALTHGATLYTDNGFQVAFQIGAVIAAVGAIAAVLLPRKIQQVKAAAVGGVAGEDEPGAASVVLGH
ncbi:MFS transporter [Nocardia sp. CA2R105]|uniref:MFS transporter n=1 Tax=Nocardia coffeae TaxID=2873381 RepID=UPI001CA7B677|nr:MFS transporter [Nocardia coffeae]MBY8860902.1 MFS transporter [Nocardia coffeae]